MRCLFVDGRRQRKQPVHQIGSRPLRLFEHGKADFADCLVERTATAAGCDRTVTFDKSAGTIGMTLLVAISKV